MLDAVGRRRSPAMLPGYHAGRPELIDARALAYNTHRL
jgi:hypothetical protein